MTADFAVSDAWSGRPVARRVEDARPRGRMVVTGLILKHSTVRVGGALSALYTLDDGTGAVDLLFLGRGTVAGLGPGTGCTVEGTAQPGQDRLVIWNPLYRIDPPACEA